MEEVASSVLRQFIAIMRWVIVEAIMETLLYWSGRGALKLFSFGRYPKRDDRAANRCKLAGAFAMGTLFIVPFLFVTGSVS